MRPKPPAPSTENEAAKKATQEAVETWRNDHANDVPFEAQPCLDRTEVVLKDEPTYRVTQYSDGTIRTDNLASPAPKVPAITPATMWGYKPEDMAQLRQSDLKTAQVTEHGIRVTEEANPVNNSSWFNSKPRGEFGDDFKRR